MGWSSIEFTTTVSILLIKLSRTSACQSWITLPRVFDHCKTPIQETLWSMIMIIITRYFRLVTCIFFQYDTVIMASPGQRMTLYFDSEVNVRLCRSPKLKPFVYTDCTCIAAADMLVLECWENFSTIRRMRSPS